MRLLDLCAGIGGFSLAASWLGVEVAGQVEIDPWCRRVLAKHWPNTIRMADVFDVKGNEFGAIDIITAGFPCQPYSVAGKRRGSEDDRAIWPQIARITRAIRPTYCLFENVPGIIGFSEMGLDGVLADLEAIGYTAGAVVIPAGAVNALHRRDRVWIMAYRDEPNGEARSADRMGTGEQAEPTARLGSDSRGTERMADTDGGKQLPGYAANTVEPGRNTRLEYSRGSDGFDQRSAGTGMADTNGAGQQEQCWTEPVRSEHTAAEHSGGNRAGAAATWPMDAGAYGISPELVRRSWADGTWEIDLPRVVTQEAERKQKLQAAGNAIVPQVAYEILREMIGEAG